MRTLRRKISFRKSFREDIRGRSKFDSGGKQAERKRWIKLKVWNRLPLLLRPFLLFFRNYIFRGGFWTASPGFIYHLLWSIWYPFLIDVKILEIQRGAGAGV